MININYEVAESFGYLMVMDKVLFPSSLFIKNIKKITTIKKVIGLVIF